MGFGKSLRPLYVTLAGLALVASVACSAGATPTSTLPLNTPTPTLEATIQATPTPTVNVVSLEEFRKGLEYLITIGSGFRATPETNRLVNDVNNFLYYNLTGADPNKEVVSVVVSYDDMKLLQPKNVEEGYGLFAAFCCYEMRTLSGGRIVTTITTDILKVLEKYGFTIENRVDSSVSFPEGLKPKMVTVVTGESSNVVSGRRGIGVLAQDNHERGHARDILNSKPYLPNDFGTPISVPNPGDYQSAFNESLANIFDSAAMRLAQQFYLNGNLLTFADTEENRRRIDGMDKFEYLERLLPWLAVLGDPNLLNLAVELRTDKVLSSKSLIKLQDYLMQIPIPERKNYTFGLFSAPSYSANVAEVKHIALSRLSSISPAEEAPFELKLELWMP